MKTEQEKERANGNQPCWLCNKEGQLSAWRGFLLVLIEIWFSAQLVLLAGTGPIASAALTAILAGGLVYASVILPAARLSVERRTKPRVVANNMDSQTSLATRASITAALLNAMAYSNRYGHPLSVAMVDLDMLSAINSGLGRKAGDKALRHVSSVLMEMLRMPDRAGRYGEEEFLVILPNTIIKNAIKIAERLRDGVESAGASGKGRQIPITVSIGVVQFRKGEDLEDCLTRANKALAEAKRIGRNRVATDKAA